MKGKISIIILCLLLILIIALTSIKFIFNNQYSNSNEKNLAEEQSIAPQITTIKTIELCIDKNNCPTQENTFGYLEYNYENQKVQEWIKNINAETEQYYQEVLNSDTSDKSCSDVSNIYNHSISIRTFNTIHNDVKYLSFAFERIKQNLCTNNSETISLNTFIYDKEKQQEITQEELMKEFNITDADIEKAIKQNIEEANQITNGNTKIEDMYINNKLDYTLYFNNNDAIIVAYYYPSEKSYYYATIQLDI